MFIICDGDEIYVLSGAHTVVTKNVSFISQSPSKLKQQLAPQYLLTQLIRLGLACIDAVVDVVRVGPFHARYAVRRCNTCD